jgi:ATP-binding cassette subfamily B protein
MLKILKTFYRFYAEKKLIFVLFILLLIATSVVRNIAPYFYKLFVDAIPQSDFGKLITILITYTLIRYSNLILDIGADFVGGVLLFDSAAKARITVFKHLEDLDFAFHASKSTGSLISAIKRGDGAFFEMQYVLHMSLLETLVGFLVMIYFFSTINLYVVLLVLLSFVLTLLISRWVISYNIKVRTDFNDQEDKISGIITDNIINYDTVKLFSKENWEVDRLTNSFKDWKTSLWKYANSFRLIDFSVGSVINISVFLILFLTLRSTANVTMSVGNFVLVLGFINYFYPQLFELVFNLRNLAKNYADIQRYFGVLDYEVEIKDPLHPVEVDKVTGEIEFKNVSFSYAEGGKKNAIRNLNLKIKPGESIALVGRSGSGKTTLIKLLMRYYDINCGSIKIDGVDIKGFTKSRLRSFMGVVPQEPILFNNTIGFNIAYGGNNVSQEQIESAAELANINSFIKHLTKGYETEVGERGIKLSGGQKQRVAIARMIISNPDIVIFDEATSQLDSESERLIQDAFWKVVKGRTTIIIAHRLSTAMRADRIIVLENGKIGEEGTHQELIAKENSLYNHFWRIQTNVD